MHSVPMGYSCNIVLVLLLQADSRSDVESELESVRNERSSVIDDICGLLAAIPPADIASFFRLKANDICELLADIPPADITSLFRLKAGLVQKKLARRLA